MDSIEFIQSIYKGENIHECENHLKGFLKAKVQELIPEHFEEIKRYKELKENSKSALEIFESVNEPDDGDLDESLPADVKEKVTKALKSISGFKKIVDFEAKEKEACVAAKFKVDEDTRDEDITAYKSKITKALAKVGLKKVEFVVNDNDDSDEINFDILA